MRNECLRIRCIFFSHDICVHAFESEVAVSAVNKMELHFYDELKKRKKLDTVHRFLRTVHVPTSVGINPRKCFKEKKNGKGIFKKKAHECKDFFLTGLFESCLLAGGLGDNEIKGFIKLRRCLNILCSVKISTDVSVAKC